MGEAPLKLHTKADKISNLMEILNLNISHTNEFLVLKYTGLPSEDGS